MKLKREQQLLWILGYKDLGLKPGSFYAALLDAALKADRQNLAKIAQAFPNTASAVQEWNSGLLTAKYGIDE